MSTTRTHPRSRVHFHRETASLRSEVLVLGSIVEKATLRAVEALRQRDVAAARAIDAEDALINRKRFDLEEASMLLMATQQPMASDLRQLAAILHVVTDLERMGGLCRGYTCRSSREVRSPESNGRHSRRRR